LLWADDRDVLPAGVPRAKALPHGWRGIAEKEAPACCGHPLRVQRIAATVVHDQSVRAWNVAQDISRNLFVMHALVSCTDVDRRVPVPVLNPPHKSSDAYRGPFKVSQYGHPRLPSERGPARRPSLCHVSATLLFAKLETTGSQCNRIVQRRSFPRPAHRWSRPGSEPTRAPNCCSRSLRKSALPEDLGLRDSACFLDRIVIAKSRWRLAFARCVAEPGARKAQGPPGNKPCSPSESLVAVSACLCTRSTHSGRPRLRRRRLSMPWKRTALEGGPERR
jgi:hypothetical protein